MIVLHLQSEHYHTHVTYFFLREVICGIDVAVLSCYIASSSAHCLLTDESGVCDPLRSDSPVTVPVRAVR